MIMKTFSQFLNEINNRFFGPTPENNDPTPGKAGWKKEKKIINRINNSDGANVN